MCQSVICTLCAGVQYAASYRQPTRPSHSLLSNKLNCVFLVSRPGKANDFMAEAANKTISWQISLNIVTLSVQMSRLTETSSTPMQKEITNLCEAMAAKSVQTPAVVSSSPTARPSKTACRLSASTVKNSRSCVEVDESPSTPTPAPIPCRWDILLVSGVEIKWWCWFFSSLFHFREKNSL